MSVYTKDNFPEISSIPHWGLTWSLRVLCFLLFGSLIILIYFIPLAFYIDGSMDTLVFSVFGTLYYPVLIYLSYRGLRYLRSIRGNAVICIFVNREGVFCKQLNGLERSVCYSQLVCAPKGIAYDVFAKPVAAWQYGSEPTTLNCFFNGEEQTVQFRITDLVYSYYTGNSHLLTRHFVQGIALFRPELRISPNVYSLLYIEPQTYEFAKKDYVKTMLIAVIWLILILLALEWYMWYRFDASFIF